MSSIKDERPLSRRNTIAAWSVGECRSFFNINRDEVNHRFDRALAASKALRGQP